MEKIYIECDGCGKEIKKQNSYSIYIYQNPDENGGFTANGAIDNLNNYIYFEFSFEQNDDGQYICKVDFEKLE